MTTWSDFSSRLAPIFTDISLFNFGLEMLPIAFSLVLSFAITNDKKWYGLAFTLVYLVTFLIGWAGQLWLLVVASLLAGVHMISVRRGGN